VKLNRSWVGRVNGRMWKGCVGGWMDGRMDGRMGG
jgi:hypothetical protein